jgi:hypothetical protein
VSRNGTVEELLEDILVDACGEDEQLWAFHQTFEEELALPAQGTVIGEPVTVTKIDYDGNPQRGLRATCKKSDGKTYEVALADVELADAPEAMPYMQAYRQWLGVAQPRKTRRAEQRAKIKQTKALVGQIDVTKPIEMILLGLSVRQETARCRVLETGKELTLRSADVWDIAPGEIINVTPKKHWSYAGHPYLSGSITSSRFNVAVLNLKPLKLNPCGTYDPKDQYWGEEGEPLEDWAKPIMDRGPRPQYEMEQVMPGVKPKDLDIDTDPISQAVDLTRLSQIAVLMPQFLRKAVRLVLESPTHFTINPVPWYRCAVAAVQATPTSSAPEPLDAPAPA